MLGGGGGDLTDILGGAVLPGSVQTDTQQQGSYQETAQEKELMGFLSVALADIEDTWSDVLPASQYRTQYKAPELTIYTGAINTACGAADAGPATPDAAAGRGARAHRYRAAGRDRVWQEHRPGRLCHRGSARDLGLVHRQRG